jgi:spoIIIJ-associated protein
MAKPVAPQVAEDARRILDTMLGLLGFFTTIESEENLEGPAFQVITDDARLLIGRHGDRLDDIQFLLNRLLLQRHPDAPKFRVDVGHYRAQRETEMVEKILDLAERVRTTGKAVRLNPLNSYHRRIVHNALKDNPHVETHSPDEVARLKRIIIRPRGSRVG